MGDKDGGRGGSSKRWRYSKNLFSKLGDEGEEGGKNLKNGWRHLWTAPDVSFMNKKTVNPSVVVKLFFKKLHLKNSNSTKRFAIHHQFMAIEVSETNYK